MNAAFLLVTTTWLAGAEPIPQAPAAPQAQKPATTATTPMPGSTATPGSTAMPGPAPTWSGGGAHGAYGGCGGCCDTSCCTSCCDEGCGHKWRDKLHGLFHRHSDCCDSCCDSCGGGHHWLSGWHGGCGCDSCDSCCDSGCGHKLFGRLHGLFNKGGDCCPTDCCGGCNSCGGYGPAPMAPGASMKGAESIPTQPKPMPSKDTKSELNPTPRLVPAPQPSLTAGSNPF